MQNLRSILLPVLVMLTLGAGASGCSRQESEWRRVRTQDTVAGYEDYLQRHPLGTHAEEARERLRALREERAWERALRLDAPEAFQQYLGAYPDGRFTEEARERLADFLLAQAPSTGPGESSTPPAPASSPTPPPTAPAAKPAPPPAVSRKPSPASAANAAPGAVAATRAMPAATLKPAAKPVPVVTQTKPAPAAQATAPRAAAKPPGASAPKSSADSKPAPKPAASPAPRPIPPPTGAAGANGAWRVQLGAFAAGQSAARSAWERLRAAHRDEFAGLEPEIDSLTRDGRTLWRLRAGRVDRDRAQAICAALRARGAACSVVAP